MAGITNVDRFKKSALAMIFFPVRCHTRGARKRLAVYLQRGANQYEKATDVLSLVRVQHRLRVLESLFFNKGQLAMIGLHKGRYLKPESSDSEDLAAEQVHAPDSADDFIEAKKATAKMLINHEFKTDMD